MGEYLIHTDTGQTFYLAHHGIKGQRWGVRRFQNEDGSLTAEGRDRYGVEGERPRARSGLTAKQKKYLKIAAGAAIGIGAAAGAAYMVKSGKAKAIADNLRAKADNLQAKRDARELAKYTTSDGKLSAAGKARFDEHGRKLDINTMTNKQAKYAAEQLAREQQFKELAARTGNSLIGNPQGDFSKVLVSMGITGTGTAIAALASSDKKTGREVLGEILQATAAAPMSFLESQYGLGSLVAQNQQSSGNKNNGNSEANKQSSGNKNNDGDRQTLSGWLNDTVGKPTRSNNPVSGDDELYQELLRSIDPRETHKRMIIKSMRKQGYSTGQMEQAVNQMLETSPTTD